MSAEGGGGVGVGVGVGDGEPPPAAEVPPQLISRIAKDTLRRREMDRSGIGVSPVAKAPDQMPRVKLMLVSDAGFSGD